MYVNSCYTVFFLNDKKERYVPVLSNAVFLYEKKRERDSRLPEPVHVQPEGTEGWQKREVQHGV